MYEYYQYLIGFNTSDFKLNQTIKIHWILNTFLKYFGILVEIKSKALCKQKKFLSSGANAISFWYNEPKYYTLNMHGAYAIKGNSISKLT